MPPTPKPPGQRRRRNAAQPQWRTLPMGGPKGPIPKLPQKRPGWRKSTREWWETMWRSPMATTYEPADVDALVRLARLKDDDARGTLPASGLSAIQNLEDRFGLSPMARRKLQWEVDRAGGAEEGPEEEPASKPRLRAV